MFSGGNTARAKAGGLRRPAGAGDVMRRPAGAGGVGADPVRRPVDARRRDVDGEYEEKEFKDMSMDDLRNLNKVVITKGYTGKRRSSWP